MTEDFLLRWLPLKTFALHEYDKTTGLYYMQARWFDPVTAQFTSEDPAMDGLNWYAYAGDNPLGGIDSTGLRVEQEDADKEAEEARRAAEEAEKQRLEQERQDALEKLARVEAEKEIKLAEEAKKKAEEPAKSDQTGNENPYLNMGEPTSDFGKRIDPTTGKGSEQHTGVDLINNETYAGISGTVRLAGWSGDDAGNTVQVKGEIEVANFYTNTFHQQKDSINVKVGDQVNYDDEVGLMGSTGRSTGDHIHHEVFTYATDSDIVKKLKENKVDYYESSDSYGDKIYFDPIDFYEYLENNNIKY